MKIAMFSTYDSYGAGTATYRLHESLLQYGCDSKMFVGRSTKPYSTELGMPAERYAFVNNISTKTRVGDTFTALHFGLRDEILDNSISGVDIVNIHWVSNFFSLDNLLRVHNKGKPTVITMHDENLYTGGCHYRNNCQGYKERCKNCIQMPEIPWLAETILLSKKMRWTVVLAAFGW